MKKMKVTSTVIPAAISDYTCIDEGIVRILLDSYAGDFIDLDAMDDLYEYVDPCEVFSILFYEDYDAWQHFNEKFGNRSISTNAVVEVARAAGLNAYRVHNDVIVIK